MRFIIGLGNPGSQYEYTYHNLGFLALDWTLTEKNWQNNKKFNSLSLEQKAKLYLKPQTFMNNSGQAASAALNYYKAIPKSLGILKKKNTDLSSQLIVIHDDLDIPLGKIKVSVDSSSAGHNGVQSIINHLKTKNFTRIRIGIKNDQLPDIPTQKLVLQRMPTTIIDTLKQAWQNFLQEYKEKIDL